MQGRVAGELEALMDLPTFAFEDWQPVYSQLDTLDDAREWRGATARLLESAPDHPGLLTGRAMSEAVVSGGIALVSGAWSARSRGLKRAARRSSAARPRDVGEGRRGQAAGIQTALDT